VLSLPPRRRDPAASARLRRILRPSRAPHTLGLRGLAVSGLPLRSLTLWPGDSLTILLMASSMGFRGSVTLPPAIQATGLLAFTPAGLPPAEHHRLLWTHMEPSRPGAADVYRVGPSPPAACARRPRHQLMVSTTPGTEY
jgi:hypothetical protein